LEGQLINPQLIARTSLKWIFDCNVQYASLVSGRSPMQGQRELWMELCAQAADEQDPQKLMQLVDQINQLLEQKEARLLRSRSSESPCEPR
jgi:hypothetical protein